MQIYDFNKLGCFRIMYKNDGVVVPLTFVVH